MTQVKVLKELFFSEILGKPIYDCHGNRVGWIRDFAVRWDSASPRVTGIKYAKDVQNHIGISQIDQLDKTGLKLKGELVATELKHLEDDEIYVGKWLLDKQIIDLRGTKIVRVNDIKLTWVHHGQTNHVVLVAVDIGLQGLLRRLGTGSLANKFKSHYVGWQYITPLQTRTANLRLSYEQNVISQLHPADIADIIEDLDHHERTDFIGKLGNQVAAEALAEMDLETQVEIIELMDSERASDLLEEMPPDEAADILGELPEEKSGELLNLMEPDEAEDVRELMGYPDGTAGALMTTEYIAFSSTITAGETINRLREQAPEAETIYYLYVVDENETLQGVLSLRDLIVAQPHTTLDQLMSTRVQFVNHQDDYSKVLEVVSKYSLLAVPVVGDQNKLLGIITFDDVLEILIPDRSGLDTFSNFMLPGKPVRRWKQ